MRFGAKPNAQKGPGAVRASVAGKDGREAAGSAVSVFMDAAAEAALQVGATQVQFVLIRGAHIVSARRMDRELRLQGAAVEDFNLEYQSEIITRAASQRPQVTVFDSTRCLQEYPQADELHYQFDGHFTKTGIKTFMNCLPHPALASPR